MKSKPAYKISRYKSEANVFRLLLKEKQYYRKSLEDDDHLLPSNIPQRYSCILSRLEYIRCTRH